MAQEGAQLVKRIKNEGGVYLELDGLGRETWEFEGRRFRVNTTGKASPGITLNQRRDFETLLKRKKKRLASQEAVAKQQAMARKPSGDKFTELIQSAIDKNKGMQQFLDPPPAPTPVPEEATPVETPPMETTEETLAAEPQVSVEGDWESWQRADAELVTSRQTRISTLKRVEAAYEIMKQDAGKIWSLESLAKEIPTHLIGNSIASVMHALQIGFSSMPHYDVEVFSHGRKRFAKINWRKGDDFVPKRAPIVLNAPAAEKAPEVEEETKVALVALTSPNPQAGLPADLYTEMIDALDTGSIAKAWFVLGKIDTWHRQQTKQG